MRPGHRTPKDNGPKFKERRKEHSTWDRLEEYLVQFRQMFTDMLGVLTEIRDAGNGSRRNLDGSITEVHGRRRKNMAVNVPVPQLLDVEKILLSVMPRKANGRVDVGAVISWSSSDPAAIPVEPGTEPFVFTDPTIGEDVTCPGAFNAFALTPGSTGTATVTASCPGYESAEFGPINYAPGEPRSLNASVGAPISDL